MSVEFNMMTVCWEDLSKVKSEWHGLGGAPAHQKIKWDDLSWAKKFDKLNSLFSLAYFFLCWGFWDQQPSRPFTCSQLHAHAGAARGGGWFNRSVNHEGRLSWGIMGFYHVSSMCPAPTYICLKSENLLAKINQRLPTRWKQVKAVSRQAQVPCT